MKPAKSFVNIANWLMRVSLVLYWVWPNISRLEVINFKEKNDIVSLILVGFSILLIIGGFLTKPVLTIISGACIALVSLYLVFINLDWPLTQAMFVGLWPLAVGLHFLGRGNQ